MVQAMSWTVQLDGGALRKEKRLVEVVFKTVSIVVFGSANSFQQYTTPV